METMEIRPGTPEDFSQLAQLISGLAAWSCYGINYDKALKLFEQMPDSIYVAAIKQDIAGFITLRTNGVGNIGAYIRMLAVKSPCQRRGVGTRLIDYVSRIALRNLPNLFLICSVENRNARRFYERHGFEPVGLLKDLVVSDHDEVFYHKRLGTLY